MDLGSFKRNTETIEGGVWVGDIPEMGGLRLKVRGFGCTLFQAAFDRLTRAVPKKDRLRDRSLRPEAANRVLGEAIHRTILLDWDGITEGGEPLPYDRERALDLLTNPDWRPFLDAVVWAARVVDNESNEAREELAKNSPTPSGGSSKKAKAAE